MKYPRNMEVLTHQRGRSAMLFFLFALGAITGMSLGREVFLTIRQVAASDDRAPSRIDGSVSLFDAELALTAMMNYAGEKKSGGRFAYVGPLSATNSRDAGKRSSGIVTFVCERDRWGDCRLTFRIESKRIERGDYRVFIDSRKTVYLHLVDGTRGFDEVPFAEISDQSGVKLSSVFDDMEIWTRRWAEQKERIEKTLFPE